MSDEFEPVTAADVTDEKLAAGELRALRAEMRKWFELLIMRLDRYEGRITTLEMHRVDANERLSSHEIRIAALEAAVKNKP
jgi:hypothetical protein